MKILKYFFVLNLACTSAVLAAHCPVLTPKDVSEIIKPLGIKDGPITPQTYQDLSGKKWDVEELEELVQIYRAESFGIEKVEAMIENVTPHNSGQKIDCAYKLYLTSQIPGMAHVNRIDLTRIQN